MAMFKSQQSLDMSGGQTMNGQQPQLSQEQQARLAAYERQVAETQRQLQEAQLRRQQSVHEEQVAHATQMFQTHQASIQHIESEEERAAHRQTFVRQFHQLYPNIRSPYDIMHNLPEHHLGEEVTLAKLSLKQGSVVQFPKKQVTTKFDYFEPLKEPMETGFGLAHDQHPDNCLPSRARQQQTYITHQSRGPSKLEVRGVSPPPLGEPGHPGKPVGVHQVKREHAWPPRCSMREMPKTAFHAEGGPKSFIWPPPRQEFHRSCLDLGAPKAPGAQNGGQLWNPSSMSNLNDPSAFQKTYAPQRKTRQWPPPGFGRLSKNNPNQDPGAHKSRDLDELVDTTGHQVVNTYRPPPWCQFYRPAYYQPSLEDMQVQNA